MSRSNQVWIDLGGRLRDLALQEHLSAYNFLQDLPQPELQYPQMISLLGGKIKRRFANELFALQSNTAEKVLLQQIPSSDQSSPLLLADCELHNVRNLSQNSSATIERHSLDWYRGFPGLPNLTLVANLVYTQLMLPFSTVVCIFAQDFQGTENVALVLCTWMKALRYRPIEHRPSTFTKIIVLVEWNEEAGFDERLATTDFVKQLRRATQSENGLFKQSNRDDSTNAEFQNLLRDRFFEISILPLPKEGSNKMKIQTNTLRRRVLQESQDIQNIRKLSKLAFNARHFVALFNYACQDFGRHIMSPFSFLKATRRANPIPPEFESKISEFIQIVPHEKSAMLAPVIASAMRLDSFPPGAHVFKTETVFKEQYSGMLTRICAAFPDLCTEIETEFCQQTDHLNTSFFHRKALQVFSSFWNGLTSTSICFSCLARSPEVSLECKHSICETCVLIHGKSKLEEPWLISIKSCPLCKDTSQKNVRLKPSTAGVRGLVLDGGTKFDLDVLQMIENNLTLPMGIAENFDVVMVSGLGGFELIDKFCSADASQEDILCLQKIKSSIYDQVVVPVSRFSYSSTISSSSSYEVAATLKRTLNGALKTIPRWSDTIQSSMMVISALNKMFGNKTLFESGGGHKLGITVNRTKDSATCVLSNYNGSERSPSSYVHVREQTRKGDLSLSQCARMSLSSQKSVRGYQSKRHSNPKEIIDIIHAEQNAIWDRKGKTMDVLIALGAHIPKYDNTVPNITYPNFVDFRRPYDHGRLENCIELLLASWFYIELVGIPHVNDLGKFSYCIQIRCRLPPDSLAYRTIIQKLQRKHARFSFDYQSIPCVSSELHNEFQRGIAFSRRLDLVTSTMDEIVDIRLSGIFKGDLDKRSISNCPYPLKKLMEDQGLHCKFGNSDHRQRYFGSVHEKRKKFI